MQAISHVTITVTTGDSTSARVLSFDTAMERKELIQSLEVLTTILKHYQTKEPMKDVR